jgi:hypothetical protein
MKMGIQKRQWLFLLLVLSLPLLVNAVAIWTDIGRAGSLQLLNGTYQPSNPNLPTASLIEVLSDLLPIIAILGLLSWLVIFMSNRVFFQKQWLIAKLFETFLAALFIAKVFEIATGIFMPLAWLPDFHDQIGLLPVSSLAVDWSRWFIFPATAILLFIAISLSRNKNLKGGKQATPLVPFEQKRG